MQTPPARSAADDASPHRSSRTNLAAWLAGLSLLCAVPPARAAHLTEVADAMDEAHPLEVDLDVGYVHEQRRTRITRETLQADPTTGKSVPGFNDELQHVRTVDELRFRLGVGLWHDLELHAIVPLALADQQEWDYAAGGAAGSTLATNRISVSGCAAPGACSPAGPAPIVGAPGGSLRAGFRDPIIGVAWGPINEQREMILHPDLFPPGRPVSTWVVGFDYTLPLPGTPDDPSAFGFAAANTATSPSARPSRTVRRKAHLFSFWTGFSKRYRVLDPYVVARVTLPVAVRGDGSSGGAYDNCWHPELLSDVAPQNCVDAAWKGKTGYKPPLSAILTLGTELVAMESAARDRKFAFDVRSELTYVAPGRDYTQVTDALGKLTYAEEYAALSGSLGIYWRLARVLHVRAAGTLGLETPHFLTTEDIGKNASAGASPKSQQNPLYDFRLDTPGRRLRAEMSLVWGANASASLNF
jgi:hypothetical protein